MPYNIIDERLKKAAATPVVLVFKTSVETAAQVQAVSQKLNNIPAMSRWSFDLEDSDHVLRIEAGQLCSTEICDILQQAGFECAALSDE